MPILAFAYGVAAFVAMLGNPASGRSQDAHIYQWISVGRFKVDIGLLLDPLSICFVLLITGVGSLIHIFAIGYMAEDPERRRFFGYMNLFLAAMLLLVLADNYLLLYAGWEGVGLASYLLIGFWQYKPSAAVAAKKAFIANRVGDAGLSLAIMLMFATYGTVAFSGVFDRPGSAGSGVLTAIGPVHLERLGSIEAIADAKSELARALPADGHLVANGDDPRVRAIASRADVDTVLYGLESDDAQVRAEQIMLADGRTAFTLVIGDKRAEVSAGLLGRHNVSNLLAAAAVGHLAGIGIEQIAAGLATVQPPEHRLAPIPNPRAGIIVIDDAYNSNPAGAAAALEVLGGHLARRRILVTPGMVELGDEEDAIVRRRSRSRTARSVLCRLMQKPMPDAGWGRLVRPLLPHSRNESLCCSPSVTRGSWSKKR